MYCMGHSIPPQLKVEVIQKSIFLGACAPNFEKDLNGQMQEEEQKFKINIMVNPNNSTRSEVEVIISEFDEKWCDGRYMYIKVFH